MYIHKIEARDLPDLWFQAVHDILEHGIYYVLYANTSHQGVFHHLYPWYDAGLDHWISSWNKKGILWKRWVENLREVWACKTCSLWVWGGLLGNRWFRVQQEVRMMGKPNCFGKYGSEWDCLECIRDISCHMERDNRPSTQSMINRNQLNVEELTEDG